MPKDMEAALKSGAARRGYRTPLPRQTLSESFGKVVEDIRGFQERGGLAGLLGMQPAASQLSEENRRFREAWQAGQFPEPGQAGMDLAMNFSPAALAGMIRAYHGTPHRFDKFDMNKIGTGEGAQAYGHGLYFAGKKGTANYYKDAGVPAWQGTQIQDEVKKALARHGQDRKAARQDLHNKMVEANDTGNTFEAGIFRDAVNNFDETADSLPGNLYTVDIDAHADELLDWDKPLSQQSDKVRKAITEAARKELSPDEMLSVFLHSDYARAFPDTSDIRLARRINDEGTAEDVAEWAAKQLEKEGSAANLFSGDTGRALYGRLAGRLGNEPSASEALRKAGIKGIRYLDQGSRAAGEGTHNYVVFDDDILKMVNE